MFQQLASQTRTRPMRAFLQAPFTLHRRTGQLIDRVWGADYVGDTKTLDVHVKRLREALAPAQCSSMIETVRGAGYRLSQQAIASAA